jgi:hypothetical protein
MRMLGAAQAERSAEPELEMIFVGFEGVRTQRNQAKIFGRSALTDQHLRDT